VKPLTASKPILSVVIVNYNGGILLQRTLETLYDTTAGLPLEVFVVDNASTDDSLDRVRAEFPQVQIIESSTNLGFSRANNRALRRVQGGYILLLNPDVELQPGAVQTALGYLSSHLDVGIVGPRVLLPNGSLDKPCRRSFKTPVIYFYKTVGLSALFPHSPRFNRYYMGFLPEDQLAEVDAVIGAFLMIRRECMEGIGLLDERFFIYCEDEDWCFRAKKAGWKVVYNPEAVVIHHKGSSTSKRPLRMTFEWHKAILQFHRKNIAADYSPLVNGLVYLGIGTRLLVASAVALIQAIIRKEAKLNSR
jgi:GT2 family glycosyltransferase